jgi:hypothetical protein
MRSSVDSGAGHVRFHDVAQRPGHCGLPAWPDRNPAGAKKNLLCPSTPDPTSIHDWPRLMRTTWKTETQWLSEPDLAAIERLSNRDRSSPPTGLRKE